LSKHKGLSKGAIAGITVASVVGAVVIVIVIYVIYVRRKNASRYSPI